MAVGIWKDVILILGFVLVINANEEKTEPGGYMRKEFSISKPLTGNNIFQSWEVGGSTFISNDHIRLTSDNPSQSGYIWSRMPVFVRDWEIHLHFSVHGSNSRLFGDGFAFWYSAQRATDGNVFGSPDHFRGLGIFFDTYANQNGEHSHEHPYISVQVNNGSMSYDHDKDGTHTELGGCTSHFRGVEDADTVVAIRYLGSKKRLTIQFDVEGENIWSDCLDEEGVVLPTGLFLGMSAQTGDLSDNHDIISMKFYELDDEDDDKDPSEYTLLEPNASGSQPDRDHVDDKPISTRRQTVMNWFIVFLVILAIGSLVGYFVYQKHQRDSLKRFY